MSKFIIALASILLLAASSLVSAANQLTPTFTNPAKPIVLAKKNHKFMIQLKSNRTTGYSWFLNHYNHNLIKPISHKYVAAKMTRMGVGGIEQWIFKVKSAVTEVPHLTKITFVYAQPWDPSQAKKATFTIITH